MSFLKSALVFVLSFAVSYVTSQGAPPPVTSTVGTVGPTTIIQVVSAISDHPTVTITETFFISPSDEAFFEELIQSNPPATQLLGGTCKFDPNGSGVEHCAETLTEILSFTTSVTTASFDKQGTFKFTSPTSSTSLTPTPTPTPTTSPSPTAAPSSPVPTSSPDNNTNQPPSVPPSSPSSSTPSSATAASAPSQVSSSSSNSTQSTSSSSTTTPGSQAPTSAAAPPVLPPVSPVDTSTDDPVTTSSATSAITPSNAPLNPLSQENGGTVITTPMRAVAVAALAGVLWEWFLTL